MGHNKTIVKNFRTCYCGGMELEKDIERRLVWHVERLGGKAWKFTSPGMRGVCDRLVLLPGGEVWFVEIKTLQGRVSMAQERFGRLVEELGGRYTCLWSSEEVDQWASNRG